jgi:hypothetical protein
MREDVGWLMAKQAKACFVLPSREVIAPIIPIRIRDPQRYRRVALQMAMLI